MSILDVAFDTARNLERAYKRWLVDYPPFLEMINKQQEQERTFTTPQARKQFHELCRKQIHDRFVPIYHKLHAIS